MGKEKYRPGEQLKTIPVSIELILINCESIDRNSSLTLKSPVFVEVNSERYSS